MYGNNLSNLRKPCRLPRDHPLECNFVGVAKINSFKGFLYNNLITVIHSCVSSTSSVKWCCCKPLKDHQITSPDFHYSIASVKTIKAVIRSHQNFNLKLCLPETMEKH